VRPQEAGLEPDGFLEELGGFLEPVLLNANGAQDRAGRGTRGGISEREPGLLVGFLEPSLFDQRGRTLERRLRLGRLGREARGRGQDDTREEGEKNTREAGTRGEACACSAP
jgi:hypothetical protein